MSRYRFELTIPGRLTGRVELVASLHPGPRVQEWSGEGNPPSRPEQRLVIRGIYETVLVAQWDVRETPLLSALVDRGTRNTGDRRLYHVPTLLTDGLELGGDKLEIFLDGWLDMASHFRRFEKALQSRCQVRHGSVAQVGEKLADLMFVGEV
mgnify:CR=1 FL=1